MHIRDMSCCIYGEICSLSEQESAEDAMETFCKICSSTGYGGGRWNRGAVKDKQVNDHFPFYVFSGVGEGNMYDDEFPRYAQKFAAYIKKQKLGTVATLKPRYNVTYHSDHLSQVFIWAPNVDALNRWWEKRKGK